jgi:plastocyanin
MKRVASGTRRRSAPMACALLLLAAVALTSCAGLPPTPGGDRVVIQDLKFLPSTLTVTKGTTVTWTNNDQTAHTVTSDDFPDPADTTATPPPGSFTSTVLNPGETYSHRFDQAGTVPYHCQIHSYLKGTVVVK